MPRGQVGRSSSSSSNNSNNVETGGGHNAADFIASGRSSAESLRAIEIQEAYRWPLALRQFPVLLIDILPQKRGARIFRRQVQS
jgi:hypothetical protein